MAKGNKLTPMQERFVDYYMVSLNATQAALKAGYSPKHAGKMGFKLVENSRIKSEIEKRKVKNQEKVHITAEQVVQGIAAIATDEEARNSDKIKAYELLGRYLALFVDRQQLTGKDGESIQVTFNIPRPQKE